MYVSHITEESEDAVGDKNKRKMIFIEFLDWTIHTQLNGLYEQINFN